MIAYIIVCERLQLKHIMLSLTYTLIILFFFLENTLIILLNLIAFNILNYFRNEYFNCKISIMNLKIGGVNDEIGEIKPNYMI